MILSLSFGSCPNLIDTSGITKNHLCSEQLHRITELAFGKENTLEAFREMQGGYCNAVYQLEMKDRLQRVILKVAPSADVRLMSCETEMMRTEVEAMCLARKHQIPGVAKVYAYDDSRTICSGEYLLMEKLEGESLSEAKQNMSDTEKEQADYRVGELLFQINSVKGKKFGHFCVESLQYDNWFDAFYSMMSRIIHDGIDADIQIGVPYSQILEQLTEYRDCFTEVTEPRLVHFDSWDGNILLRTDELAVLSTGKGHFGPKA